MALEKFSVVRGLIVNGSSGNVSVQINTTDAIRLPSGNTAQRPTPEGGHFRYNSETAFLEFYNGAGWSALAATSGSDSEFNTDTVFNANVTANGTSLLSNANTTLNGTFVNVNANTEFRGNNHFIANQTFSGTISWFNSNAEFRGTAVNFAANTTLGGSLVAVTANVRSTATINATTISFNGSTITGNSTQLNLSRGTVVNGTVTVNTLTINTHSISANLTGVLFPSGIRLYVNALSINSVSTAYGFVIGDSDLQIAASNTSFNSRTIWSRTDTGAHAWAGIPGANPDAFHLYGPTATSSELAASYEAAAWKFYTGGVQRVTITSAGRVGIGNTSPVSPLHVTGVSTLGGNTTVSGTLATGNTTITGSLSVSTTSTFTGTSSFNGLLEANGTVSTAKANVVSTTLTDGATITWNAALGQIATVTLAGNRTMAAPTNRKVGTYILHVIQDGTGNRTLTWNSVFKWTGGVAPVLTTTAGARDVFSFISDGTNLYGSYIPDVR